jgi:predicted glycosyltransferase
VLFYSTLYIGEGATTASESAMLGTPAIYVNSLSAGTLEEQERLGLLFSFRNSEGVLEKALEILNTPEFKAENVRRQHIMLKQTIDVTAFMVWFIENYPRSVKIMKENPDYQERFK